MQNKEQRPCKIEKGKYVKALPCVSPDGAFCFGAQFYRHAHGGGGRNIRGLVLCPYLKEVRKWWKAHPETIKKATETATGRAFQTKLV